MVFFEVHEDTSNLAMMGEMLHISSAEGSFANTSAARSSWIRTQPAVQGIGLNQSYVGMSSLLMGKAEIKDTMISLGKRIKEPKGLPTTKSSSYAQRAFLYGDLVITTSSFVASPLSSST